MQGGRFEGTRMIEKTPKGRGRKPSFSGGGDIGTYIDITKIAREGRVRTTKEKQNF